MMDVNSMATKVRRPARNAKGSQTLVLRMNKKGVWVLSDTSHNHREERGRGTNEELKEDTVRLSTNT